MGRVDEYARGRSSCHVQEEDRRDWPPGQRKRHDRIYPDEIHALCRRPADHTDRKRTAGDPCAGPRCTARRKSHEGGETTAAGETAGPEVRKCCCEKISKSPLATFGDYRFMDTSRVKEIDWREGERFISGVCYGSRFSSSGFAPGMVRVSS